VSYFLSGFGLIFNFQGPVGIGLSLTEFGVEFNRDNAEPNAWSKWASIIIDAGGLAVGTFAVMLTLRTVRREK
jgi:hypothetical protein